MAKAFGDLMSSMIDGVVQRVVVPVTSVIPGLVASGALLALFALVWLAFAVAAVAAPESLGDVWATVGQLTLPLQAVLWLLFLPPLAGLWIWEADWPLVVRVVLVAALAVWNVLVFIPRRPAIDEAVADAA